MHGRDWTTRAVPCRTSEGCGVEFGVDGEVDSAARMVGVDPSRWTGPFENPTRFLRDGPWRVMFQGVVSTTEVREIRDLGRPAELEIDGVVGVRSSG